MKKILVVEDDPVNQMILMDFLAANGYQTIAAASGPEGIEQFDRTLPDLCLVDVQLPRKNGFERLIVVTSPSHSLRASLALETQGIQVISVPAVETQFDYEGLGKIGRGDDRLRAFGVLLHEHVGLLYYRSRGWIR